MILAVLTARAAIIFAKLGLAADFFPPFESYCILAPTFKWTSYAGLENWTNRFLHGIISKRVNTNSERNARRTIMPDRILCNIPEDKKVQIREAIEENRGKAVLLSIKKDWLDKIANGEKTIELRKTMPSAIKFPFAVLCYETKANGGSGKVSGVFIVNQIGVLNPVSFGPRVIADPMSATNEFQRRSLVTIAGMDRYMGVSKFLYGWYVSDYLPLDCNLDDLRVKRAPQSWQYISLESWPDEQGLMDYKI